MAENMLILKEVKNINLNKRNNGYCISPIQVHSIGMSLYESDPPSFIPILDLATDDFMSILYHYVGDNKEDIKEKTICYVMLSDPSINPLIHSSIKLSIF